MGCLYGNLTHLEPHEHILVTRSILEHFKILQAILIHDNSLKSDIGNVVHTFTSHSAQLPGRPNHPQSSNPRLAASIDFDPDQNNSPVMG